MSARPAPPRPSSVAPRPPVRTTGSAYVMTARTRASPSAARSAVAAPAQLPKSTNGASSRSAAVTPAGRRRAARARCGDRARESCLGHVGPGFAEAAQICPYDAMACGAEEVGEARHGAERPCTGSGPAGAITTTDRGGPAGSCSVHTSSAPSAARTTNARRVTARPRNSPPRRPAPRRPRGPGSAWNPTNVPPAARHSPSAPQAARSGGGVLRRARAGAPAGNAAVTHDRLPASRATVAARASSSSSRRPACALRSRRADPGAARRAHRGRGR